MNATIIKVQYTGNETKISKIEAVIMELEYNNNLL